MAVGKGPNDVAAGAANRERKPAVEAARRHADDHAFVHQFDGASGRTTPRCVDDLTLQNVGSTRLRASERRQSERH